MDLKVTTQPGGVRIAVKVVPGARRERIVGLLGDALKVAVSKPPEGGAANAAVIELLARTLGVAAADVGILRGHTSPRKEIAIRGLGEVEVRHRIAAALDPS